VRDSKDQHGPVVVVGAREWRRFTVWLKTGRPGLL